MDWRWPRKFTPRLLRIARNCALRTPRSSTSTRPKLPSPEEVRGWSSEQYTSALRHIQSTKSYNSSLRQLLHVGFKVAAKMGRRYLDLLESNEAVIAKNVTENLYVRHIAPVFLGRFA